MAWNEFAEMTRNQRGNFAKKAAEGSEYYLSEYLKYSREIKKEANKRLASLERAGLDYGSTYNNLMYFLQIQENSTRLKSPSALKLDIWDIHTQNEQALAFLKNKSSLVSNARASERARINTLKKNGILPKSFSRRKNVEFLRFLGNEEVTATIEEHGSSNTVVEALYSAYERNGSAIFEVASKALTEFLANRITFDKAMDRIGVKIEDYITKKPTS